MPDLPAQALARPVWPAIGRGVLCRCPNCGTGNLFNGYIAQVEACSNCNEPLGEYNAGLLVPLLVGLLVVLVFAVVFLVIELAGGVSPGSYLAILFPIATVASLLALRPCKGGLIGLLWAVRASDER